jgi:hypothetical protein
MTGRQGERARMEWICIMGGLAAFITGGLIVAVAMR